MRWQIVTCDIYAFNMPYTVLPLLWDIYLYDVIYNNNLKATPQYICLIHIFVVLFRHSNDSYTTVMFPIKAQGDCDIPYEKSSTSCKLNIKDLVLLKYGYIWKIKLTSYSLSNRICPFSIKCKMSWLFKI